MDVIIHADIQSPLVRTLAATKGKANTFVHHIKDNIPPVSFGKLEISPDGGAVGTYQRNYSFTIPPYGFWRSFVLKFQASENGLGQQLIQDIYSSLTTNPQVTRFYGQSAQVCFATYNKNSLFGCERNAYGAVAPNNQVFVPQGWVSPFDGNVRSGNYDPWEAMWLRCNGGNSYGNQAAAGTYPNPQAIEAKGDARIAPYRQVPRFDALNAFGRNVHCLGDEEYDDGNTTGSNVLQPAACGYNLNDAVPGIAVTVVSSFTPVNGVPSNATLRNSVPYGGSYSNNAVFTNMKTGVGGGNVAANVPSAVTLVNNVPSAATLIANVPSAATLVNNVPSGATNVTNVPSGATNVSNVPSGATNVTNVPSGAVNVINVPSNATNVSNVPSNATNVSNVPSAVTLVNNVPSGATNVTGVPSGTTLRSGVPYGADGLMAHVADATNAWNTEDEVVTSSNINNDGVPVNCTINTNSFPNTGGTFSLIQDVVSGAQLSDTTGNQDVYFGQHITGGFSSTSQWAYIPNNTDTFGINTDGVNNMASNQTGANWDPFVFNSSTDGILYYTNASADGNHGGVPHDAALSSNVVRSSTTIANSANVPVGSTGVAPDVASNCAYVGGSSGNKIAWTSALSTITDRASVPYGVDALGSNVPSNATNVSGVPSGTTLVNNVPSGSTLRSGVPTNTTLVSGVPSNTTLVSGVPSATTLVTGVPSATTLVSGVPSATTLVSGVPSATTLVNNVPSGVTNVSNVVSSSTLVANVPSAATLVSGIPTNANNGFALPSPNGVWVYFNGTTPLLANNVPSDVTLVNNVLSNAVTSSTEDASNLHVSAELDWSYLVPFDGCMFHQVPRYTSGANANWFLQPDGQYTATNGNNGGSRGWAASTPPIYNTNTQMRNRYLGQRLGSTFDWCSQANLSRYLGALMVQRVTLSTHDRVLQNIYPVETLARIHRMPMDQKKRFLSLIRPHITSSPSSIAQGDTQTPGYTGEINTTGVTWMRSSASAYGTYRTFTCYFPCFFSFFEDTSTCLDTRFTETLKVDVLVSSLDQIYDPCDLGYRSDNLGTPYDFNDTTQDDRGLLTTYTGYHTQEFRQRVPVIHTEALAVTGLCYYYNFHGSTTQSIRDFNYRPNVPANILGYNTYAENPILLTAQQVCQGATINMSLTCNNLATEVIFCVRRVKKDVVAHPQLAEIPFESNMTTLPIQAVALTGSGQLLYQGTGAECMLADQWDYALSSIKTGDACTNDSGLYADSHESYYTQSKPTCDGFFAYRIPFSFSTDRTYNSGCVALQSINTPVLSVQLAPLHGWVINDDNLAFRMGSLFNLSENLNQRECDTQTVFDGDFELQVYINYFQLVRIDSNTGQMTKSLDI